MAKVGRAARVASRQRVETITGDKTIESAETGELYLVSYDGGATCTITLPAMQDGAYFKFVWKTKQNAATSIVKITSKELVNGDFIGGVLEQVTGGSNAHSAFATAGSHHQVSLTKEIEPGTWIECVCDGSKWYITGCANVEAIGKVAFGS